MPTYLFEDKQGNRRAVEMTREQFVDLPMAGGRSVYRDADGRKMYRVRPKVGGVVPHLDSDHDQYPKISKTLPQYADGADYVKDPGRHQGCPIIESRRHQDELCRRHSFTREFG